MGVHSFGRVHVYRMKRHPASHPHPLPRIDFSITGYPKQEKSISLDIIRLGKHGKPAWRRTWQVTIDRKK